VRKCGGGRCGGEKQKAHRQRRTPPMSAAITPLETAAPAVTRAGESSPAAVASTARKRPKVANTVARIEQGSKRFTLSGSSLGQVLRFVLAFLLTNDLLGVEFISSPMAIKACNRRFWPSLPGIHGCGCCWTGITRLSSFFSLDRIRTCCSCRHTSLRPIFQ